jgi:hypothetical protein
VTTAILALPSPTQANSMNLIALSYLLIVTYTEVDGTRRQNAYSFPTLTACEAAEARMKETITKTEAVLGVNSQAKFECEPVEGETV